ncbi:prepilin-type N-terminal cleavage/methylation domain-containing protein [Sulfurimonas sp.]|uniref:type IV pilus modification PilV family protein n=1 Tax=Sulfurimonas sp. TaxID=2022749 RepID=UPI002B483ECC|nr:prepilin-type N-terminal cleavage/methylation domain-containing protein [Sulfurimonas sp.]
MSKSKNAFTLVEVMVAVMIISVVIMALLQMQGNSNHMFSRLKDKLKVNQYTSFFISNADYGFEKNSVDLDDVLSDFIVEDDLRRELKKIKVEVQYKKLRQLDMSENDDEDVSSEMIFEIGKTILKANDSSASFIRFRVP